MMTRGDGKGLYSHGSRTSRVGDRLAASDRKRKQARRRSSPGSFRVLGTGSKRQKSNIGEQPGGTVWLSKVGLAEERGIRAPNRKCIADPQDADPTILKCLMRAYLITCRAVPITRTMSEEDLIIFV